MVIINPPLVAKQIWADKPFANKICSRVEKYDRLRLMLFVISREWSAFRGRMIIPVM